MALPLDVCIRGDGIVGRTLALLLARERLRVGLVMPEPTPASQPDVRAYALNQASKDLLTSVRCWPDSVSATPVLRMQVADQAGGAIQFEASTLGTDALTWIVDVPVLQAQLADAVRFQPQIELLHAPVKAALTVVCEGRASRTREEFGVDFEVAPYGQHALATRVHCEKPHAQVAQQWFSEGEVLAFLPLDGSAGHSVAVVWSVSPEQAKSLQAASDTDFCTALQTASRHCLGTLTLAGERAVWPLQSAQAQQWTGGNESGAWALAGDAAHNVHPLAGQGLNLGLADVAELASQLQQRAYWRSVGDPQVLRRYERARKAGMLAMARGGDSLHWLFSQLTGVWPQLRRWGMNRMNEATPLKQWLARQAMDI